MSEIVVNCNTKTIPRATLWDIIKGNPYINTEDFSLYLYKKWLMHWGGLDVDEFKKRWGYNWFKIIHRPKK